MSIDSDIKSALDAAGFEKVDVVVDDKGVANLRGGIDHQGLLGALGSVVSRFDVKAVSIDGITAGSMQPVVESAFREAGFDQLRVTTLEDGAIMISGKVADSDALGRALDIVRDLDIEDWDSDVEVTET